MPVLVGWIISAVLWVFKNRIGFILLSILGWLGLGFATQQLVIAPIITEIKDYVAGMSTEGDFGIQALAYLRYLKFDIALTMVFSAYVASTAMGAVKAFLVKRT